MSFVATLICNPATPILDAAMIEAAGAALPDPQIRVLAEGVATDLAFDPGDLDDPNVAPLGEDILIHDYRNALIAALGEAPVDVVVQPLAHRRKKLLLADMDSTMIAQECIDELADYVGLKPEVAAITERAMRGELPFEPALRERVALLKGLALGTIDEIVEKRLDLTPGGRELIATMRANGAWCALVSGGFTVFTSAIAGKLGFDEHRANRLVIADETLAGTVEEPIVGREAKYAALIELRERHGLAIEETLAVGDGANDLAMLGEAGLGVAYHAKPSVAEAAGARIDHADLTALLYIQGYARADFAEI
ncbi:MAG: phosphoserine phosphatase SerB [Saliniramus fredricksonii]|uniref:Phosphoserine phosphatase n=1 Tax=Saliniramus fredricksonii TaxID=1653334 RepID=A0A0P8A3F2_9HYPH|nr:phosphoserine phosphatase SerB [Saliniramus fredricksonii]KPQ09774.1 MAG: phosphoserine phosphatase SerB [Saliniramus fredricksonii]SCC80656.1 phosphoserine phosphatase [Saliniramus fredricksonii]